MINYLNGYVLFPLLEKASKRQILEKLAELKRFEKLSLSEQNEIQRDQLYKTLIFCRSNVPYYEELFKKHSFDIEKVRVDVRYLSDLPILTKAIIKENVEKLRMSNAWHERKTGGSTGQSVHFYYDNEGLDWTSAINLQAYDMAKNYRHKRDCHISSELGIEAPNRKSRFYDWLKLFSQNRKRIMIKSFSQEDLEWTFLQLKRFKPYMLQGHPSSAYAIAEFISKSNLKTKKYCKVFEPSGEMLTPKMVNSIEENLGCKVVNRYGNAEFGVMAHSRLSDPFNKLKVFNRAFLIEECNSSDLIATGLTNSGMPLIRYQTGDIATVKNEEDGTFIYDIQGRIHDRVRIDGKDYATHYIMDYLDHKIKGVREFQIHQKPSDSPTLKVVPEREEDFDRIKLEVLKRWPAGMRVEKASFSDFIGSGWRQKFRHVVNLEELK